MPHRRVVSKAMVPWVGAALRAYEVMPCTKTWTTQRLTLPEELFDVLRWHVATQLRLEPRRQSDLLFPSELGPERPRSSLAEMVRAIGLTERSRTSKRSRPLELVHPADGSEGAG